jgi:thioredoxin reductase
MKEQAKQFGASIEYAEVLEITASEAATLLVKTTDQTYAARAVVVANGMKARELTIAGLEAPVHYCATCDAPVYKDQKVAVVGGGDSAFQTALFLASFAEQVYIVARSEPRAKGALLTRVEENPKITLMTETLPTRELLGDELGVAAVFAEIGSDPQELPQIAAELVNAPGLFYAGDCRPDARRQVVAAAADGALVAEAIRDYLTS